MGREASYGRTKLNNAKEDTALSVLLADPCYQRPDAKARKQILRLLDAEEFSSRAFDLIKTASPSPLLTETNAHETIDALTLIEVKATQAPIVDTNLHGFFFGATENEYRLAARLGTRYLFAFVVLNPPPPTAPFHVLLTLAEVEERTKTRRIQYQVNLKSPGPRRTP